MPQIHMLPIHPILVKIAIRRSSVNLSIPPIPVCTAMNCHTVVRYICKYMCRALTKGTVSWYSKFIRKDSCIKLYKYLFLCEFACKYSLLFKF